MLVHVVMFSVLVLCTQVLTSEQQAILPPYLKVCQRNHPRLEKCIASAIETLRPYLKKGIPEIGVPPCEPLAIPEVLIKQGEAAIQITTNYTNIRVSGPSRFQLKTVRVDLKNNILALRLRLPSLHLQSDFTMHGRFLLLPISGSGRCRSNYTDIDVTGSIQSERYEKNGETFWNVRDFFLDFEIGDAEILMEDFFSGNEEIEAAINGFINDNWRSIADEIKPSLETSIGDIFKHVANNIFHKYSIDTLLPL